MTIRDHTKSIQTGLIGLGYSVGTAGADGYFGTGTRGGAEAWLKAGGKPAPAPVKPGPLLPSTSAMIYQGSARYPVDEIIVHCAATRPDWMAGNTFAQRFAEIRRWHVQDRGWKDIGYHWVIDRDGAIMPGRKETVIGAHTADDNKNRGTIGICLLGGHGSSERDQFAENFTAEQDRALRGLIASIGLRTQIKRVMGHNSYAAKACPGFNVPSWFAQAA